MYRRSIFCPQKSPISCHCIRCTNHRREHSQENERHTFDWFISEKGMYVGLKQPRGDGERYVTPARAAAKETI